MAATAATPAMRLLVFDLPYARVWEGAVRTMDAYPLTRAADGTIETQRMERAPQSDELDAERVAERITVRVEATGRLVTRVTVDVVAEALRDGRWEPFRNDGAAARAVLDRIRARIG
jgi:hypothetical protein